MNEYQINWIKGSDREEFSFIEDGKETVLAVQDYEEVYLRPGLYEQVVQVELKCCSPETVSGVLRELANQKGVNLDSLRVVDLGAGNGVSGEALDLRKDQCFAIDVLPEAKEAALRDRPEVYADYLTADINQLNQEAVDQISSWEVNTVSAAGGHISEYGIDQLLELINSPGLFVFSFSQHWLEEDGGFGDYVKQLLQSKLRLDIQNEFVHRKDSSGEDHNWVVLAGTIVLSKPDDL